MSRYSTIGMLLFLLVLPLAGGEQPAGRDSLTVVGPYDSVLGDFVLLLPPDYSDRMGEHLRGVIQDVALALTTRFGAVHRREFQVVVVDSRKQLEIWSGRRLPAWIQAMALEYPPRVVILGPATRPLDPSIPDFEQTLLHELTHIYLYRLAPQPGTARIPGWFHEGLAVLTGSGLDRHLHWALLRGRLLGRLYSLDELTRIHHTSAGLSELAYAQAVVAVQTLEATYGETVYRDLFDYLRQGISFREAFASVTGESLLDFHLQYRDELRRRYNLLLALSHPNVLFILLPILVVTAYLFRLQRSRVIRARWKAEEIELEQRQSESTCQEGEDEREDAV